MARNPEVSHKPVTLTQPIPMARHTHLMRRGSQYYVNVRVPKDLRDIVKKDIVRRSLHTSDPREAVQRVRRESLRMHDEFEQLRVKRRGEKTQSRDLSAISEREAYTIASRYFTGLEKMSERWWENEAAKLDQDQLEEALDVLRTDEVVLTLLANGKRNPSAAIMLAILAETARSEIETLVERIKSGLAEAKRKGKVLGRPKGTSEPLAAFLERHKDIVRKIRVGHSIRNCAKITGKGISTVQRVKLALAA